jgi:predicted dehydrogenase
MPSDATPLAPPSREPLRLGVCGAGRAFERLYLPALRRTRPFLLAALADPDPARLATAPAGVACFDGLEAMLDGAGLDAVAIVSPPRLHAQQAALVASAELPALVEKPLALSLEEVHALEGSAPLITPSFSRRYWPAYRRLEDAAAVAQHVTFAIRASSAAWGPYDSEPVSLAHDFLPHLADLARSLAGVEPVEVEAQQGVKGIEAALIAGNGRRAVCRVISGDPYREAARIDGRAAGVDYAGRPSATFARLLRRPPVDVAGFAAMLNEWATRLRGETPERLPSFADGWASVAIVESVVRSLDSGRRVPVARLQA